MYQQWHPSDASALALLGPWQNVFNRNDWDLMLSRSIVPKLQWAMQVCCWRLIFWRVDSYISFHAFRGLPWHPWYTMRGFLKHFSFGCAVWPSVCICTIMSCDRWNQQLLPPCRNSLVRNNHMRQSSYCKSSEQDQPWRTVPVNSAHEYGILIALPDHLLSCVIKQGALCYFQDPGLLFHDDKSFDCKALGSRAVFKGDWHDALSSYELWICHCETWAVEDFFTHFCVMWHISECMPPTVLHGCVDAILSYTKGALLYCWTEEGKLHILLTCCFGGGQWVQ